jgi:hypothetical protein
MTERFPFYKPNESEITREIRCYLRIRGIWHYKNWGGPMSQKGISDITAIYKGIPIYFEVKTERGKLTESQRTFLEEVNLNGGLGIVLRSIENVIEACEVLKNGKDLSVLREKFSH